MLESRFLDGNKTLFEQLENAIKSPDFWRREDFFHAKMQEKEERYQRYHNTGYNLEPDIKYSPGGLRDLHLLYWIALRHLGVKNLQEILDSGFIYPEEHRILNAAQQFLFKLRFALHLVIKRYDNRLLFDRQVKVSEMLGYQGKGNQAVEQMMKAFFRASHDIMELTQLLLQHYQEHFIQRCDDCAVQILDKDGELIPLEAQTTAYGTSGDERVQMTFYARLAANGAAVSAGDVSAIATWTTEYQ